MDKKLFITHKEYEIEVKGGSWNFDYYNSHDIPLAPLKGLLNFKKVFTLKKEIKNVSVKATALGVFHLYVNGKRVGRNIDGKTVYDELTPGWTDFRIRVMEYEYDITDLCSDVNTVVADVSPGWWSGRIAFGMYGNKSCAFASEITVVYADGTAEIIETDESWDSMIGGPTKRADIWDGQYDDYTFPHPSTDPEYYTWDKAIRFDGFEGEIVPFIGEYVRVNECLAHRPLTAVVHEGTVDDGSELGSINVISKTVGNDCEKLNIKAGQSVILDLGQEIVGWPTLTFKAERGTELEVFFAELLNDSGEKSRGNDGPRGSMYVMNYRSALARYVCIASGEGIETHSPSHVFYGFRYIEIKAKGDLELISVVGEVIGSDLNESGSFECDNPEVNQLYSNVVWGMRGNYLYIPTDCPQRNERLGWTGDTQIFCGAASYIADIRPFMHKWLTDARDSQVAFEGAYGDVIPRTTVVGCGRAAWADAGLIVPYRLWLMYHDEEIIRTHYDSMEWYMQYLTRNGLNGPDPHYGDWLNYDVTDKAYISACYYAYDASLMVLFSNIIGKTDRAKHYSNLRADIINEWTNNYIKDGFLTINTQCAYLLAFAFDMVPDDLVPAFKGRLRELIEGNDYTLSTGFVGTGILCQTLEKVGMSDLAYSLLLQTKDPSWLYSVRQGATTVWERWNSYTKEKGFGHVGMNSFNHYAYGAVAEWLYSGVCGILPDENDTGFGHFILKPTPDLRTFIPDGQKRICSARATYSSYKGKIESGWSLKDGAYVYTIVIPEGTTATISIISDKDRLTFNTLELSAAELNAKRDGDRLTFELGAGKYVIKT